MFKRIITLFVILSFSLSIVSPGFATNMTNISADTIQSSEVFAPQHPDQPLQPEPETEPAVTQDINENMINLADVQKVKDIATTLNLADYKTEDELKQAIIGDEKWVENFPNGLFNFVGTQFQMNEQQASLEIAIVRQGGTQGSVSVDFKAIDVSAEYGKDYIIRVYENSVKNEMDKNEAAFPLMQTVGENASINISESDSDLPAPAQSEPTEEENPAEAGQTTDIDANMAEATEPSDINANMVEDAEATDTDANVTPPAYTDLSESVVTVGDGNTKSVSSLRAAREAYLGETSDRPDWRSIDEGKVENLKAEYDQFLYNVPGTETTLEFADGEYIKYLYLIPLNDTISESEEQVLFALERPGGGASRGEFYMAYVNIADDEAQENPRFKIAAPAVIAADGKAAIVVERTSGLQQYASVVIGTEEGTALPNIDYEPGLEELFFTPGMATQTVYVNILDNPQRDGDRQFSIALDRSSENVDDKAIEALVTIPAPAQHLFSDLSATGLGLRTMVANPSALDPGFQALAVDPADPDPAMRALAATAPTNINAEMITPDGYSPAKGQWNISGWDYFRNLQSIHELMPAQVTSDGVQRNYSGYHLVGDAYPISSLGGVDKIRFYHYNGGNGQFMFSLDRNHDFLRWPKTIAVKLNPYSKKFQGSYSNAYETPALDAAAWKNTQEIVMTSYSTYATSNSPYFSEITLKLKAFDTQISAAQAMPHQKYRISNGVIAKHAPVPNDPGYTLYNPGSLYIKSVHSNVGNYQEYPADPKVYRSDRLAFGYSYSEENPNGKYAQYAGFEVKSGVNWIFFAGTELVLDAAFFKKSGIIDGIMGGTIEIRPVFSKNPAHMSINFDDVDSGYLLNAPGLKVTNLTYLAYDSLFVGDVITDLEAKTNYASKSPRWTSYGGPYTANTTMPYPQSIVATDPVANSKINYVLDNVKNWLMLDFNNPTLIVKANPNVYKHGLKDLTYKLDGTAFADRNAFTTQMAHVFAPGSAANPELEMSFAYAFDEQFPDPGHLQANAFGTPQMAYLYVYKNDSSLRNLYKIPYDPATKNFKFTCHPKELGWESGDYACVVIEGSEWAGTQYAKTMEIIIDFLTTSADGILVTPPDSDKSGQIWAGNMKTPVTITSANPTADYKMNAMTSPGFIATWQDSSADDNNDGQMLSDEKIAWQTKLRKIMRDEKLNIDQVLQKDIYWGNSFTYTPRFFDPSKVYYTFEKISTVGATIEFSLNEKYKTVLNASAKDYINHPIKSAEVYIGAKMISDTNGNGIYTDTDPMYYGGHYTLGQVYYRGQIFNFAAAPGNYLTYDIYTSDLMRPYDFKAVITKGSKAVDQELTSVNDLLYIDDATTTFSYRLNGSLAGVKPNDSIIRFYDAKDVLVKEVRTGIYEPRSEAFTYSLNTYKEGIKTGYTMTIAGLLTEAGNIVREYPEVRVGLVFSKPLSAISVLASYKTPIQPVVKLMGKLSNQYDLDMDVNIKDVKPTLYTDSKGNPRKIKTVTFGFNGDYAKKFEESAKDTAAPESKDSIDTVKDDAKGKEKEDDLSDVVEKAQDDSAKPKGSGGGDFQMTYQISLALTLEMGQKQGEDGDWQGTGFHYFSALVIMATAHADYRKEHTYITPIGIPVTASLTASGDATAVLAFEADHQDPYNENYKLDGEGKAELKSKYYDIYSKFILTPTVTLGAASGFDYLELEIDGTAAFNFHFDVPITGDKVSSAGGGNVQLSATLTMEILFVQKSWTLYKSKKIDLFNYGANAQAAVLSAMSDPYRNYLYEKLDTITEEDIVPRTYLAERGGWNDVGDESGGVQGVYAGTENILRKGCYPNPQTELIQLGDNKTLLLFIDDDASRDARNRAALMYSVLEGETSTSPLMLDDNGTWDQAPDAFLVGERVLVTWSDASRLFTPTDTEKDILSAMDISGAWFDLQTGRFGEKFAITKTVPGGDAYADLKPMISYDPTTQRLMVYYTKTDYDDRWTTGLLLSDPDEVLLTETPAPLYGDIVNGYNVIAYRYADWDASSGEFVWNQTYAAGEGLDADKFYGQRFLELAPPAEILEEEHDIMGETIILGEGDTEKPVTLTHTGTTQTIQPYVGLTDPRILETDLITHDGRAVYAYIIDCDNDLATLQDQQLYVQTYDYAKDTFSCPIEITNNNVQNTQPHFVYVKGVTYLYWLQDGKIVSTCIDDILRADNLQQVTAPDSGKIFAIIDKRNAAKEAHITTAVAHNNPIEEYEIITNGNSVYALWTEDCISYRNGLQPGDEGTENPANINMERHIFAAGQVCEGEKNFPWSTPIQVTLDAGENYSDLSFVVPADNQFLAAYARSRKTFDEEAGHFTNEEALRTLAVNVFTITNDLELGEIATSIDDPLAGATVDVSAWLTNTGLDPYENFAYQLYVKRNGTPYYESEWVPQTGSENPAYILGGDSIPLQASFVMPETLDGVDSMVIGFNVKNEADVQLAATEKGIHIAPDVELKVKECYLTSKDSATVNLYAENNGNQNVSDTLALSAGNQVLYTEQVDLAAGEKRFISLETALAGAAFSGLYTDGNGGRFDLLTLDCTLGGTTINADIKRQISAETFTQLQQIQSFAIDSNGVLLQDGGWLTVRPSHPIALEAKLFNSIGAAIESEQLEVVWKSSNPEVVSTLSDGLLIPLSTGIATITATLQPISKKNVSYADQSFEILDTSYTIPDEVKKEINVTVYVNSSSGSGASGGSVPDQVQTSIPYTPKPREDVNALVVYLITEGAAPQLIKTSWYNPQTGKMVFKADAVGQYVVGYSKTEFKDDLGWAAPYITFLASRNIIKGVAEGEFAKDKMVTRAEILTMLFRLQEETVPEAGANEFADVAPDAWYAEAVKWAYMNGIVNGTGPTTFSPNNPINREEMATMLKRYMDYAHLPFAQETAAAFNDHDALSDWSATAVDAMKAAGIMVGSGNNNFNPQDASTRAEAAKVITEILKLFLK